LDGTFTLKSSHGQLPPKLLLVLLVLLVLVLVLLVES
jgi:hypothetical protein